MNPYLAIARRDYKQSRWFFSYFIALTVVVITDFFQEGSIIVLYIVMFPIIYTAQQIAILKASFAHRAGFLLPKFRDRQFKYSIVTIVLFSLVMILILHPTFPLALVSFGALLFLQFITLASFNQRVSKISNLVVWTILFIGIIGILIGWPINQLVDIYIDAMDWTTQNPGITVLIGGVITTAAFSLLPWLYSLTKHTQELTPEELPLFWRNKNKLSSNKELLISSGFSEKWLSGKNTLGWQRHLRLISKKGLLDKGLFGGAQTSSTLAFLSILLLALILVLFIGNILALQFGYGVHLHQESLGLLFGAGLILCSLLINITLCSESVSAKNIMVKLLLLDNGRNRRKGMGRLFSVISLRYIRFYLFFTLVFLLMAVLVGTSFDSLSVMLTMAMPCALMLPLVVAYGFWATATMPYSAGSRMKIFATILVFLATGYWLLFIAPWFWMPLLVVSLLCYLLAYYYWNNSSLELV